MHKPATQATAHPTFAVVGAGRVGLGLAAALRARGWHLTGVWNRGAPGRNRAARFLRRGAATDDLGKAVRGASVVLVAVSDGAVAEVGGLLAGLGLEPRTVVAHTSGVLPASALDRRGAWHAGSLHPLVPCTDPGQASRVLVGANFGVEGDAAALRVLNGLVRVLGGKVVHIAAGAKARYHGALVLASNLLVALLELATSEARAAGLRHPDVVLDLAQDALTLVRKRGPRAALTGPVLRGDHTTVRAHLEVLGAEAWPAYVALSKVALRLAYERGLGEAEAVALLELLGHEA